MKHVKSSILLGGGFAGGLLAGWILSTCKQPEALRNQKERAETAVAKINSAIKEGTERLREVNYRLKKELTHPIPDLYRATESLTFDETELIYD